MRILHIISGLGTGGAERMLERLVIDPHPGVIHAVISLGGLGPVGERLRASGIEVTALGWTPARALFGVAALARMVRRCRPDIVQTWLYHADVLGGLAARAAGVRAIAWSIRTADTRRGISLSASARIMLRLSAALSSRVPRRIVYVAQAARRAHEAEGYAADRGIVIHNGFAIPDLATTASAAQAIRAGLAIPADATVIGTAGTFTAQKNQLGVVAAAAPLLAARANLHLLLMGARNTADNTLLAEAVAATGHADRIHLLGERRDIAACLAALDLFVLGSRGEGFPNVVGEAMAVATPVLTTDVGDAAIIVGDTGTVVPPDDAPALRAALETLVAMPHEARAAWGRAARDRIATRFSLDAAKTAYLDLYRSMANGDMN